MREVTTRPPAGSQITRWTENLATCTVRTTLVGDKPKDGTWVYAWDSNGRRNLHGYVETHYLRTLIATLTDHADEIERIQNDERQQQS